MRASSDRSPSSICFQSKRSVNVLPNVDRYVGCVYGYVCWLCLYRLCLLAVTVGCVYGYVCWLWWLVFALLSIYCSCGSIPFLAHTYIVRFPLFPLLLFLNTNIIYSLPYLMGYYNRPFMTSSYSSTSQKPFKKPDMRLCIMLPSEVGDVI